MVVNTSVINGRAPRGKRAQTPSKNLSGTTPIHLHGKGSRIPRKGLELVSIRKKEQFKQTLFFWKTTET